jgi:hypothetical protein
MTQPVMCLGPVKSAAERPARSPKLRRKIEHVQERDMAHIQHLAIRTENPEKIARYYEEVFGWTRLRSGKAAPCICPMDTSISRS